MAQAQGARMVELVERHIDLMDTDEFRIIKDGFMDQEVCTSLGDDDAQARANLIPPKDGMLWQISVGETISCYHNRRTHRHMVMLAVGGRGYRG